VSDHIPPVDLWEQHGPLEAEIMAALREVLRRGDFVLGEALRRFEDRFAAYCGAGQAIGVSNGTAALHLSLLALGIGPGDEVIAPAHTFVATVSAIVQSGARPELVDIEPDTCLIDVREVERAITPRTRAIIPVHLYGQPADMDALARLAADHGLALIEDASQAHGATYQGRRTGSLGDVACFSLYPSKNLGACGEAGVITTGADEVAEAIRTLRDHARTGYYDHARFAFNERLDTLQAAILGVKLAHLDEYNAARRECARLYTQALADTGLILPREAPGRTHVYHQYVIRTPWRDELRDWLRQEGIGTGIHYPIPVHLLTAAASLGYGRGDFPAAERVTSEVLSLPMYPGLRPEQIERVAASIRGFLSRRGEYPRGGEATCS